MLTVKRPILTFQSNFVMNLYVHSVLLNRTTQGRSTCVLNVRQTVVCGKGGGVVTILWIQEN